MENGDKLVGSFKNDIFVKGIYYKNDKEIHYDIENKEVNPGNSNGFNYKQQTGMVSGNKRDRNIDIEIKGMAPKFVPRNISNNNSQQNFQYMKNTGNINKRYQNSPCCCKTRSTCCGLMKFLKLK